MLIVGRSRLPSSTPLAASTLPEAARRLLLQSAGSDKALRFGGLWNKLERGVSAVLRVAH